MYHVKIKEASAHGEDAWKGAGIKVGVQVWRIVKFKVGIAIANISVPVHEMVLHVQVTHWPKEDYGRFYNGDSYIILNTYKKDPSTEVRETYRHTFFGGSIFLFLRH